MFFSSLFSSFYHRQRCAFFVKQSGLMFLRFSDLRMWLFPMVANHQSNDAMFAMYRSSLDIEQSWLTYLEKGHTLREKIPRKKFQLFKRAQMEGKLYQSRPRSVAHNSKKPKSKPRDENGSSLDHKKVWSRESNNGRQKQQRHERGSSILRKDQKKKGGRGEVDYDF